MMAEQRPDADRKNSFPASEASEAFTRSLAEMVQAIMDQNRARFVPPENVLRFRHGESWNIKTLDTYSHVLPGMDGEAAAGMEDLFS